MYTLNDILERIENKKRDYKHYDFSQIENIALMTFFDLSQEYDNIDDFYNLCVAIPRGFFDLNARFYVIDPKLNTMLLIARTDNQGYELKSHPPDDVRPNESSYYTEKNSLVLTIRGNKLLIDQLPFRAADNILGILEVYPIEERDRHNDLFFEKYANRIGFNMHNKFLAAKNIEHLKFIRSLVADIEHNVIVPNMVYRLFLKRLNAKIMKNVEIEKLLSDYSDHKLYDYTDMEKLLKELQEVNQGLTGELENIEKHYKNMSLFLETLFRRSHFDHGKLILRTKACNMKNDVVQPQLERYMEQFRKAGISIDDRLSGIPDEEVISVIDVGLIAQVYANLFTNALKYTQEIIVETGEKKKYISYGRETAKDFFGDGRDGIKYNVFSTGKHIQNEEREKIFEEGYRGKNTMGRPGTGHGLTFIKNAIEIHGGAAGYEATQYGNNFYFIIPRSN